MINNYNVWYPYDTFSPGSHFFFFFNNLYDLKERENSANEKSGEDLALEVSKYLNKNLGAISSTTNEGLDRIKQVLTFLQETIKYERGQEIAYYSKYFQDSNLPESLKQRFAKIFDPDNGKPFDYIEFINLINVLHMGAQKYKTVISYETNRLNQLQEVIEEFLKLPEEQQWARQQGSENREDKGFYQNFNSYLADIGKGNLISSKTISNALQEKVVQTIPEIWGSQKWQDWIVKKLKQLCFKQPIDNDTMMVLSSELLNAALPAIEDATFTYLSDKHFSKNYNFKNTVLDKRVLKETVETAAMRYIDKIIQNPDPSVARNFVAKIKKQINSEKINLDNDTKRFLQLVIPVQEGKRDGEDVVIIAQDTEKILTGLIKEKTTVTSKKRDEIIKQFVELYGDRENYDIINNKWDVHYVKDLIASKLVSTEPYIRFHIASKDNLLSETFASGNNDYLNEKAEKIIIQKIDLAGGYQKADTYGVINEDLGTLILELDNGAISRNMQKLCNNIVDSYMESIEIQPKNTIIQAGRQIFNEQEFRKSQGFSEKEFSIDAETERRLIFLKSRIIELKQRLKNEGATTEQIENAIKMLKDTVQISSTVKSYNKYNNLSGFHGGSLGGSVENQLKNIVKMYSYGGINSFDIKWLTFAVYNSASNMLGSHLKEPLEHIFSAVAGMLLFDDAGEQALFIQSQLQKTVSQGSSKFLHLYNLNNVFLPSSYVLQLTYNNLLKVYGLLESEFGNFTKQSNTNSNSAGARITIENNVSQPTTGTDWSAYFSDNKKSVSLNIVFLAGFLDIIKKINDTIPQ